jgi:hypothetical protein
MKNRYMTLIMLCAGIVTIFLVRIMLADTFAMPHTFQLFDMLTVATALIFLLKGFTNLRWADWLVALTLGLVVGIGMLFATLFSPYPFFGLIQSHAGQAVLRGFFTATATLGGLVIMQQGGPIQFHATNGNWHNSGWGVLVGLMIGLPLAVLNVFALQFTQGQPIQWQNPLATFLDALQPGIVEEVIYRFALWGFLWLALRKSLPEQATWLAGLLSMLVHTYSHYDELFLQAPLVALGMGAAMALLWGLPLMLLARRRGLESAIAFHWLQDVVRFVAGY